MESRGYLVEGAGHCSACHTPRNAAGAELKGAGRYTGAMVDGWWAPPLGVASDGPVPWSRQDYFDYLRHGHAADHGVAGGPMAPVIAELRNLPDSDLRAMATYLAGLGNGADAGKDRERAVEQARLRAASQGARIKDGGSRAYEAACAICHDASPIRVAGLRPDLALNGAVHAPVPDNLLRTMLFGARSEAFPQRGMMPAFEGAMTDAQIEQIARYVRARFASDKPAWDDIGPRLRRIRAETSSQIH